LFCSEVKPFTFRGIGDSGGRFGEFFGDAALLLLNIVGDRETRVIRLFGEGGTAIMRLGVIVWVVELELFEVSLLKKIMLVGRGGGYFRDGKVLEIIRTFLGE